MRPLLFALAVTVASGARADVTPPKAAPTRLASGGVPKVLLDEWRKAENRARCAPLWLDDLGVLAGGNVRRTTFAGGWAVAFDQPGLPGRGPGVTSCPKCGRSVAGIAGVGLDGSEADVARWKLQRETPSGIRAGYGLEGFTIGPDWLAYVIVPGQSCLYNVWSFLGREHLELLLDHLRVVDVSSMLRP
jgi:hypothetical protein